MTFTSRDDEPRTTLDQIFDALSHPTRRRLLTSIADDNPRDTEEFQAIEFIPDTADQSSFTNDLIHAHLPKLADLGFIDWDQETQTVTRGPRFEEIRPLLTLMENHQDELPENWP